VARKGLRIEPVDDEPKRNLAAELARKFNDTLPEGADELCEVAAQGGLDPSGVGNFCRIVAQDGMIVLSVGYRGLLKLAMGSGELAFLDARPIYARDTFALDLGTQYVKHAPYDGEEDPGALTGAWAVLIDTRGMKQLEYVTGRKLAASQAWYQAWMPAEDFARKVAAARLLQTSAMDLMAVRYFLDVESRTAAGKPLPKL
jgi:hypothetical protein